MVGSRTLTALAGVAVSLLVSVLAYVYLDTLAVFLFVPFVPFLFRRGDRARPSARRCPECGFTTRDPDVAYCPRDGTSLSGSETTEDGDDVGWGNARDDGNR